MTVPLYNLTDTWNDLATTFTAIQMNVTNTQSAANSQLIDLQVGGTSKFSIRKEGKVKIAGGLDADGTAMLSFYSSGFYNVGLAEISGALAVYGPSGNYWRFSTTNLILRSDATFSWASDTAWSAPDLYLIRDAAGVLAQRNSTSAQVLRVYNTFTDALNNEGFEIDWQASAGVATIGTFQNGTGSGRDVTIKSASGAINLSFGNVLNIVYNGTNNTRIDDGNSGFLTVGYGHGVILNRQNTGNYFGFSDNYAAAAALGFGWVADGLGEIHNGTPAGVAYLRFNGVAVASLPAASATYKGARGTVTDANATLTAGIGAVVAGGGSNVVPVFCDGTNWRIG